MKEKVFNPNLEYIFTKKKYINDIKRHKKDWRNENDWVNNINGRKVNIFSQTIGQCGAYTVLRNWCKCITKNQGGIK